MSATKIPTNSILGDVANGIRSIADAAEVLGTIALLSEKWLDDEYNTNSDQIPEILRLVSDGLFYRIDSIQSHLKHAEERINA